jgi:hypothetical protein
MGILVNWLLSSVNDAAIPYLRDPVGKVLDEVVHQRGLPSKGDLRDLRDRVEMADFRVRELNKTVQEVRGQVRRLQDAAAAPPGASLPT